MLEINIYISNIRYKSSHKLFEFGSIPSEYEIFNYTSDKYKYLKYKTKYLNITNDKMYDWNELVLSDDDMNKINDIKNIKDKKNIQIFVMLF